VTSLVGETINGSCRRLSSVTGFLVEHAGCPGRLGVDPKPEPLRTTQSKYRLQVQSASSKPGDLGLIVYEHLIDAQALDDRAIDVGTVAEVSTSGRPRRTSDVRASSLPVVSRVEELWTRLIFARWICTDLKAINVVEGEPIDEASDQTQA
jgi:hypothetical protein